MRSAVTLDLLPLGPPPDLDNSRDLVPPGRVRHGQTLTVECQALLVKAL